MKRTFSLLLILLALWTVLPTTTRAASSYNSNDTMSSADVLTNGKTYSSTLGTISRYVTDSDGNSGYQTIYNYDDYYRFTLNKRAKVKITLTCSSTNTGVYIMTPSNGWITYRSGSGTVETTLDPGNYYILVTYRGSSYEDHTMKANWCLHPVLRSTTYLPTCTTDGYTHHFCSHCALDWTDSIVPAGHSYGNWYTVAQPTCTSRGTECRICRNCSSTEERYSDPVAHTVLSWTVTKQPTCTTDGTVSGTCTVCLARDTRPIAANGHTYGDWVITQEATCTESGSREQTCQNCGDVVTETIAATGHTKKTVSPAVIPTCEKTGLTEQAECSVCWTELSVQQVVPALGHSEWVSSSGREPTCTNDGLTARISCGRCHKVLSEQQMVPAMGHTIIAGTRVEPTCTTDGSVTGTCTTCHQTATQTIPALAHTPVTDPAVEPACTKTGLTEGSHCSVCKHILVEQTVIPALGHNFVDSVCTNCGLGDGSLLLAEGTCGTNVSWKLYESGLMTISGNGKLDYYGLSAKPWQDWIDRITHLVVEEGVTDLQSYTFDGCSALQSVILPKSITCLGYSLFEDCTALKSVTLPEGLRTLESSVFSGCSALEEIRIPSTVTRISGSVFFRCTSLKQVVLPEGIPEISNAAFYNCTSLTEVVIPDTVTSIDESAFYNCVALEKITVPGSVITIWARAFYGCKALKQITFTGHPPAIYPDAFATVSATSRYPQNYSWQAEDLQNYGGSLTWQSYDNGPGETLPEILASGDCGTNVRWMLKRDGTLTISGSGAMKRYSSGYLPWQNYLGKIRLAVIAEGITSVSSYAFEDCFSLETVSIAGSVTAIGSSAFYGCEKLAEAVIPAGVTKLEAHTFGWCSALKSVTLPEGLVSIGNYAFNNCNTITEIDLPSSVTSIGDSAFYYCEALTDLVLPDVITSIGSSAFYGCVALKRITFSGSAPTFGSSVFARVSANVYYPENDTTWDADTMQNYGGALTWKPLHIHSEIIDKAVASTCIETGLTEGSHCSGCGTILVPQNVVPVLDHSYGNPAFQWTADYRCNVSASCTHCGNTENKACTVAVTRVDATETKDGKTTYRASVTFGPKTFTDTKTIPIPATGHITHTAGTQWHGDSAQHWKVCIGCDKQMDPGTHIPGPVTTENTSQKCTVCDFVISLPLGLDWVTDSTPNPDNNLWFSGYYAKIMEQYGDSLN